MDQASPGLHQVSAELPTLATFFLLEIAPAPNQVSALQQPLPGLQGHLLETKVPFLFCQLEPLGKPYRGLAPQQEPP